VPNPGDKSSDDKEKGYSLLSQPIAQPEQELVSTAIKWSSSIGSPHTMVTFDVILTSAHWLQIWAVCSQSHRNEST
jgi:hypothetical protein